jgi:hypothetical protein
MDSLGNFIREQDSVARSDERKNARSRKGMLHRELVSCDSPVYERFRCGTPGETKAALGLSSEDVKVRARFGKGLFDPITAAVTLSCICLPAASLGPHVYCLAVRIKDRVTRQRATRNLCYPTAILHETLGKTWTHPKLVLVSIYCSLPVPQSVLHSPKAPRHPSPSFTSNGVPRSIPALPRPFHTSSHSPSTSFTAHLFFKLRSTRSPSPHRGPSPAPFKFSARAPSQEEGEILGSSPPPLLYVASVRSPLYGRRLLLRQLGPHERRLSLCQPGLQRSRALTNSSACHRAHPRRCGGAEPNAMGGGSGGPARGGPQRFNGMGPQTMPSHRSEPHQQQCPNR